MEAFTTQESRRRVLECTYAPRAAQMYTKQKREVERWEMMEGTKQNRTFLSADLPSSPCNLRACWEKQQGILGKTEGGLYLIQTTSVCVGGGEECMCSGFIIIVVIVGFVSLENNFSSASIFGPD